MLTPAERRQRTIQRVQYPTKVCVRSSSADASCIRLPFLPLRSPSTAHLPFSTFLHPSAHPPRRPATYNHRLAIPLYNMPAAASAGLHLDHHHHHHHHSSISMPSSTHRLSALSDSFYGQVQYSSQYQAQFARDSQQYPAQQVAYYPPMPDRVYPPSSLSLSFPAQFPPATVVHNQFIPPQHHYSAPAGTGSSAVPQLSVSVNITPPPPQVAHKVWILDCKSCGSFLTNRGMKVRSPGPFTSAVLTAEVCIFVFG